MAHTFGTSARLPATDTMTTANPATFTITCASGTTVLWLGIVVSGLTARTGGSPTYNGIAMTQIGAKLDGVETHVEHWYLLDPPTGSAFTISVPNSGTLSLTMSAATALAGTRRASVLDSQDSATGVSTNPSASVACTQAGDIAFAVCGTGAQAWAPTGWSGVQLHDWDPGTRGHGGQYVLVATVTTQATNWTFGTSDDWAIANVSFRETRRRMPNNYQSIRVGAGMGASERIY